MKRRTVLIGLVVLAGAAALAAWAMRGSPSSLPDPGEYRQLNIVVTVPPLAELASRLAPEGSKLTVLMPPGRSEHGYEFTSTDLAALARADVVVFVGLGLEPQVEKFVAENPDENRRDVCFAVAAGINGPAVEDHADHDHEEHGDGHEHADHGAGYIDPHLWLDPQLVARLVPVLSGAVGAALRTSGHESPKAALDLIAAEDALANDIQALDAEYRRELAPFAGASIVTHHNAWSRVADRYGLKVAAVLRPIENAEPTPAQIAAAVAAIKEHKAATVFVEPQFDSAPARQLAQAAGAKTLVLDPLGRGEWFSLMRENLKALKDGLTPVEAK